MIDHLETARGIAADMSEKLSPTDGHAVGVYLLLFVAARAGIPWRHLVTAITLAAEIMAKSDGAEVAS